MSQYATYYRIESKCLGSGPLLVTRRDVEDEREFLLSEDPADEITIVLQKMKPEEYEKLPEHQGY